MAGKMANEPSVMIRAPTQMPMIIPDLAIKKKIATIIRISKSSKQQTTTHSLTHKNININTNELSWR
jgi:hypothetical protein